MKMQTRYLAASAAIMAADNAASSGGTPPATEPAVVAKYYLAEATERSPEEGKKPLETTFVVEGADYKAAWEHARKLTAQGDAHFKGNAWTKQDRLVKMTMVPATFTVHKLTSLQARSTKKTEITAEQLIAKLEGDNIPAKDLAAIKAAFEGLQAKGPIAEPTVPASAAPSPAPQSEKRTGTGG